MPYLTGIDPGLTTGIVYGWYEVDRPLSIDSAQNFTEDEALDTIKRWYLPPSEVVVFERFILSGGNQFTADLTAKVIEGFVKMKANKDQIVWQLRSDKALISDQWQKDNGYWLTGKRAGWTDGRDVNDAIKHMLVYLMRKNHGPTIQLLNPKVG